MPIGLSAKLAVCDESIEQRTTRRENTSSMTAQYAFPSRVGCSMMSVTHNRLSASEVTVRRIGCCRRVRDLVVLRSARKASETAAAHHELDSATRHGHVPAEHEFGMHTSGAVGLTGLGVHVADHVSDHLVSHRPRRRLEVLPCVEPGHRHTHDPARRLDREAGVHDRRDDLTPPFGSDCAFSNSLALRVISSSFSNSRIRWRSADSPAD